MKAVFIVNPAAGKGRGLPFVESFKEEIDGSIDYHIEVTQRKGAATDIARDYCHKGKCIIFAVGGDGTVNEVVNGMAGSESILAVLPTGSGNDFVRTFYPKCSNEELLRRLLKGSVKKVDLVQIQESFFLNIASIGLDAEVAYNFIKYKKLPYINGEGAYFLSLIKTILGPKGTKAKIKLDGQKICNEDFLMLTVANGRYYGGGIAISPHAKLDDGMADICFVKERRLRKLLPVLLKLLRGTHEETEEVQVYHAKEIEVMGDSAFKVNVDGEIWETKQLKMKLLPRYLNVMVP